MKKRSPKTGKEKGIAWKPLQAERDAAGARYTHLTLNVDGRAGWRASPSKGRATASRPPSKPSTRPASISGAPAFRELDDALLHLRFNYPTVGLLLMETKGDVDRVLALDRALFAKKDDWLVREILLHMRRVLRRIDTSARSVFALAKEGSCFAGSLLEIALAADRLYMLDGDPSPKLAVSPLNGGILPTFASVSRLAARFWGEPERAQQLIETMPVLTTPEAMKSGLVTFAPDDIDWDDEIRVVVEERTSYSPDAMTGMSKICAFPAPRRWRPKSSGVSRPGKIGSFNDRMRWAPAARSRGTANRSDPVRLRQDLAGMLIKPPSRHQMPIPCLFTPRLSAPPSRSEGGWGGEIARTTSASTTP